MSKASDSTASRANGELRDLKADMAALRQDFAKLVEDAGAVVKSSGDRTVDHGRDALNSASSAITDQKDRLEDRIRENPFASMGIAFGVGMLLAAVSRR